jgi:hypothetical protein
MERPPGTLKRTTSDNGRRRQRAVRQIAHDIVKRMKD